MFTHLHVHTQYSLLDGMCRIPQLVARTRELGMDSLAITDHGVMYGAIEFYQAAKQAGIKPIIGCEVYVAPTSRLSRKPEDKESYHLILLAKNQRGYRNLIQLGTKAHLESYYYKPRVDKELLAEYHHDLIALTACLGGEVPHLILTGRLAEAKDAALWYKQTFGDFYLEIQRQPTPELKQLNPILIDMGNELDIPLVATNDVHYLNREDAETHDLLLCIGTNATIQDTGRIKMAGDFFYLKSPQEMAELYPDIPEALANTERITEQCDLKLDFGRLHLPEMELPPGKNADQFLADLCYQGLPQYYPEHTPEIERRLEYELEVIKKTRFANYFLVVWDIISFAKKQNILFGVRGSAAASMVLHCLGITEVDPIQHNLVFERFLNIERKEMPDIDIDFEDDRRDEVISYISQRYGSDHVAQIITFGTLGARAALRDVGRALGMAYSDVDRVARLIPFGPGVTLDSALEDRNSELKSIYDADPIIRRLVDSAKRVEGIARHASTHAAGVVISKEPLTNYVPLQRVAKGTDEAAVMTQFTMEDIARIGLLKMDILGLINLTTLKEGQEIIRQTRGIDIDLPHIPLDDRPTFDLLSSGETTGVFQLDGAGMRRFIRELKPTTFSDIAAMVALYRPGPMQHIPTFIKAKHGEEAIHYPHPALASILKETYGVIVYQDQVLLIVRAFAGYSLGQADIFRKAMGKKIPEVMRQEKSNFIAGAVKNGFSAEVASEVFALIEPFAGYAFNKAHSASYALIAYQTAYLKANYPVEYMTAYLVTNSGDLEKVAGAVADCRRLGITVLAPDINRSQANFAIETEGNTRAIRFGLAVIKNVGVSAVAPIIAERSCNGPFKSIEDLCHRCDLHGMNKRVLESLIKAGAFDSLGDRGSLLPNINRILSLAQREQRLRETGQGTMFDLWGETVPTPTPELGLNQVDIPVKEKLSWEKELMGVCLTKQPFCLSDIKKKPETRLCGEITAEMNGQTVTVIGEVAAVSQRLTRERKPFVSATVEDISGSVEVMVWPRVYEKTSDLWQEGNIVEVKGKVRLRDDEVQVNCDEAGQYQPESQAEEPVPQPPASVAKVTPPPLNRLVIRITETGDEARDVDSFRQLVDILKDFPGEDEVHLCVVNEAKVTNLKLANVGTRYCPDLRQRLAELVGEDGIKVESVNSVIRNGEYPV